MENNENVRRFFYVRLLTYDNACKLVNYIKKNDENDQAYITTGGVGIYTLEKNIDEILDFLDGLEDKFELSLNHPSHVKENEVEKLKRNNII